MALIACPACGREVSDAATACPHCGHPLKATDTVLTRNRGCADLILWPLLAGVILMILLFLAC